MPYWIIFCVCIVSLLNENVFSAASRPVNAHTRAFVPVFTPFFYSLLEHHYRVNGDNQSGALKWSGEFFIPSFYSVLRHSSDVNIDEQNGAPRSFALFTPSFCSIPRHQPNVNNDEQEDVLQPLCHFDQVSHCSYCCQKGDCLDCYKKEEWLFLREYLRGFSQNCTRKIIGQNLLHFRQISRP